MDINLQTKKNELIQWLTALEDESVIDQLMNIRKKHNTDFWNELSLSEQEEIEKGIEGLDNGKRISYESSLKKLS